MKNLYRSIERGFEKLVSISMAILGNSLTFIIAQGTVIFYLCQKQFYRQSLHTCIGDIILSFTFLTLFVIQKSYNRFSASLHLKVNELVASHESASNLVINLEKKTEHEMTELLKEYTELANLAEEEKDASKPDTDLPGKL